MTIRTRLMLMMLFVSLLACAVLGILGSRYGNRAITKEVNDQLNLTLSAKQDQINLYLIDIARLVEIMGQTPTVCTCYL